MGDESIDVNAESDSSADSTASRESEEMGGPLGSEQQSESGQGVNANESLADFIKKNVKVEGEDDSKSSDAEDDDSAEKESSSKTELDKEESEDDGKAKSKETEKEEEGGEKEDSTDGKKEHEEAIPYDRFKEKVTEVDTLKKEIEEYKPELNSYRNIVGFCTEHNISADQFNKALEIQALLNTNPAEALKQLLPIVDSLQGFVGNKLPADLQEQIDKGNLTVEYAKEIAQYRAQKQFGEKKIEHDRKQLEARERQAFENQVRTSVRSWDEQKRQSDPDYKPKGKDTDTDGVWELTRTYFLALLNKTDEKGNFTNQVKSSQDALSLMEQAYKTAKSLLTRKASEKPAKKVLNSNGSSPTQKKTIETAKSMREAMQIAADGRY